MATIRITLVFPPQWRPFAPYLALPSLAAVLRRQGHDVQLYDANLNCYRQLLTPEPAARALSELDRQRRLLTSQPLEQINSEQLVRLAKCGLVGPLAAAALPRALAQLADPRAFMDPAGYLWALRTVNHVLLTLSAAHHPEELSLYSCHGDRSESEQTSMLGTPLSRCAREVLASSPELVGISVSFPFQLRPALDLARRLRQQGGDMPIVLGGAVITRTWQSLPDTIFDLVDALVAYEAESILADLLCHIQGTGPGCPPGVRTRAAVGASSPPPADLAALPAPDFEGLPVHDYLSPTPVLPVQTSRGCYWRRCAFCDSWYTNLHGARERPAHLVAADIAGLSDRWRADHFFLMDDSISPRMLGALPRELDRLGADVRWGGEARFEPGLTRRLLTAARDGGLCRLMFGLESGSPRVLSVIDKGIDLEIAARIIRDCSELGISVHLFTIVGFPGETQNESKMTIDYLRTVAPYVDSIDLEYFALSPNSIVHRDPERFGVRLRSEPDPASGYCDSLTYDTLRGMGPVEARSRHAEMAGEIEMMLAHRPRYAVPHDIIFYGGKLPAPDRTFRPQHRPADRASSVPRLSEHAAWMESEWDIRHLLEPTSSRARNLTALRRTLGDGQTVGQTDRPRPGPVCLAYSSRTDRFASLGRDSADILHLLDGTRTAAAIAAGIAAQKGVDPAVALDECLRFLDHLTGIGLIQWQGGDSGD